MDPETGIISGIYNTTSSSIAHIMVTDSAGLTAQITILVGPAVTPL